MALRVGLIGTGVSGDKLLAPGLAEAEGAELWSVLSRDKARAADFAARHGAKAPAPAFDDLDALLGDPELDAVFVASPDKLHAAQTIRAAGAGKHVLLEKPMVTDPEEGRATIAACEAAGVTLALAYHMRWHAGHRAMRERAMEGGFGKLRHMRAIWPSPQANADGWRSKTDIGRWWSLAAVGTHCLDQVRWFMGPECGEAVEFKSVISNAGFGTQRDETAVLAMRFENGATAEICSSVLFNAPKRMELYGTEGYAVFEDTLGPHGGGRIETGDGAVRFNRVNPYAGEIADFAAAVREGRPPEVDGREGLRNVELLLRAVQGWPARG